MPYKAYPKHKTCPYCGKEGIPSDYGAEWCELCGYTKQLSHGFPRPRSSPYPRDETESFWSNGIKLLEG